MTRTVESLTASTGQAPADGGRAGFTRIPSRSWHSLELTLRMLRYRVAAMLWMFLLLGAAVADGLRSFDVRYVWASVALAGSYVAATTVNDIADRDIDRWNHPRDRGRPLVTGEATVRDLVMIHLVGTIVAIACAAPLGWAGLTVIGTSLLISYLYSLSPIRLSYRTYLAPLVLAVAYVLLPFTLGLLLAADEASRAEVALLAAALYALFVARISLKDFRDRDGDARYGKPTLLLRLGKTATCLASGVALLAGDVLLLAALRPPLLAVGVMQGFVIGIAGLLYGLWRADDPRDEQVAIGIGARLGNGLLLLVLGWLVLVGHGAASSERLLFAVTVAVGFGLNVAVLWSQPQEVLIGYKG